jgi:hypothetical protein
MNLRVRRVTGCSRSAIFAYVRVDIETDVEGSGRWIVVVAEAQNWRVSKNINALNDSLSAHRTIFRKRTLKLWPFCLIALPSYCLIIKVLRKRQKHVT